jgi:Ca2+-binding EF-hand superfamily protein
MVNTIKNGYLNDEEWKSITQYLFQNENDLLLLNEKINNYIQKNNPNEYKIKYQQFIQIIIEFQIKLRDIYLKNFNAMFKNVDKGRHGVLSINEFLNLMDIIGINNKNRINEYLNILDPYKNGMILYSDVIGLLSTEMIYEKDPETDEVIEMSLMDKIAMQVS